MYFTRVSLVNINLVSKYEENQFKNKEVITNFNNIWPLTFKYDLDIGDVYINGKLFLTLIMCQSIKKIHPLIRELLPMLQTFDL